jgi:polyphosphate kinase 2
MKFLKLFEDISDASMSEFIQNAYQKYNDSVDFKDKMVIVTEDFYDIKEEIDLSKLDSVSVQQIKHNLITRLGEYRTYILDNISYNTKTNKIEYKNFERIEDRVILRELTNEFGDIVDIINISPFLRKINQLLELKLRNTKKRVREAFDEYYKSIEERIENSKLKNIDGELDEFESEGSLLGRKQYESEKYNIQIELLKLQEWVIKNNKKLAIVFEGRDAAGKGSTIKRFIEYLNPKGFKVVALGLPSDEEKNNWFKRYEKYLPAPGEMVFFDRSWYNRAVVEPAMGYCTEEQYTDFIKNVLSWEEDLILKNDVILIKFWFSITKEKQLTRFELRQKSPLKYWKFSPNDAKVIDKWDIISKYKKQMFLNTTSRISPWVIVNSNDKKIGRLNAMRYLLSVVPYEGKDESVSKWYSEVINIIR